MASEWSVASKARYSPHSSPDWNRSIRTPPLVCLGAARMGSDAPPPCSAGSTHYFAYLCHRGWVGSVGTVSAHFGWDVAWSSRRYRTRTRILSGACARCICVPQPAGMACHWRCGGCVHRDTIRVHAAISSQGCDGSMVI